MAIYLKKFENHTEYEEARQYLILPNVSYCVSENEVHYNPLACEESSTYELVGTPSYPSEVDGASTSFDMTFNYKRTDINEKCSETVTEGSDTVTVEIGTNPSTASSRTVEGTYDYHGLEIAYSVTQTKFEAKVTAKFNVTDTSSPTRIINDIYTFTAIEIDGVEQPSVVSTYTFTTTGEHTVKYTLTDPTSIGYNAFMSCTSLTSIDIPDSVTSIGSGVFSGCTSLTSIDIPSGVTNISNYVFYRCSSLTSIEIPNGVTSIEDGAFFGCISLTRLNSDVDGVFNIPSGVTSIGNSVFAACSGLTSIDIPSGVTSIEDGAFNNCISLTRLNSDVDGVFNIPSGVTKIGQNAFRGCSGLTSIDIPSGVTSIDRYAFYNCISLTSIDIPSGVTSIGSSAFQNCSGLTSITVNATTPPTLGSYAFHGNASGRKIYVPSESVETYKSTSGWSDYASSIQAIP